MEKENINLDKFVVNINDFLLKFSTFGGLGIWTIIDWFLIMGATRKANYKKFIEQMAITLLIS